MAKNLVISVLAVFFAATIADGAAVGGLKKNKPLTDGFVMAGIDGKLTTQKGNGRWFFEFDSDVRDDRGLVKAGVSLELLPSAALEKMSADAEGRSAATYRLWGRVTRYERKNFIFPIYFLPISEIKRPQSPAPEKSQQQEAELTINDPNDALTIPEEIVAKLRTRKIVRVEQLKRGLELKTDCILADRTGFIRDSGHGLVFVFDALGRNVQQIPAFAGTSLPLWKQGFPLLPCYALERAQQQQSVEPDPLRFKVSGIVTKYKGQHYLLLQRAARVYSHQNFSR